MTQTIDNQIELDNFRNSITEKLNDFGKSGIAEIKNSIHEDVIKYLSEYSSNLINTIKDIDSKVISFSSVLESLQSVSSTLDTATKQFAENSSMCLVREKFDELSQTISCINNTTQDFSKNFSPTDLLLKSLTAVEDKATNSLEKIRLINTENAEFFKTLNSWHKKLDEKHAGAVSTLASIETHVSEVSRKIASASISEFDKSTECLTILRDAPFKKLNDINTALNLVKEHCKMNAKEQNHTLLYALLILNIVSTLTALAFIAEIL